MARFEMLWLVSDIILDWPANRQSWDAAAAEPLSRGVRGDLGVLVIS